MYLRISKITEYLHIIKTFFHRKKKWIYQSCFRRERNMNDQLGRFHLPLTQSQYITAAMKLSISPFIVEKT